MRVYPILSGCATGDFGTRGRAEAAVIEFPVNVEYSPKGGVPRYDRFAEEYVSMTIFMVAVLPLSLGLFLYAFYPDELRRMAFWGAFLKGILVWIASFLIYIVVKNLVNEAFTFGGLFAAHLLHDFVFFFITALAGYILFFGLKTSSGTYDLFPTVLGYLAGTQVLLSVADLIIKSGWFDIYALFFLPVLRACLCVAVALIISWSANSYGPSKYVLLAASVVPPALFTFVPALFGISQHIAAYVVAAVAISGVAIAFLLTRRARV